MDVTAISNAAFAVYISHDDLKRFELCPGYITCSDIKTMLNPLLKDIEDCIALEVFPGNDDLLIFARRESGNPELFAFDSIEDLIASVWDIDGGVPSSLYFADGRYVLVLCGIPEEESLKISEFGEKLEFSAGTVPRLEEYGKLLASPYAVSTLKTYFCTAKKSV